MAAPVPIHYTIRPANRSDQRQLRILLQTFIREQSIPIPPSVQVLGWAILGGVIALGLHIILFPAGGLAANIRVLLGVGAIVGMGMMSLFFRFTVSDDWPQFWVVEHRGRLIGCAKLCRYKNYSTLYNVLIATPWRRQGIGTHLVRRVAQAALKPLYLACRPERIAFYKRLGFEQVSAHTLSAAIYRDLELTVRSDIVPLVLWSDGDRKG